MDNPFGARALARGFQLTRPLVQFDTVRGSGPAVISHAHADHIAENRKMPVYSSPPTADLLRARGHLGDVVQMEFDQWHEFDGWRMKLLPAGHVLGSAQILVEREDGLRLLYTGDMKTRAGRTCEPARFERADDLITECTFGLPSFRFPPEEEIAARMVAWARECLADGLIPVFLGYALGKGQEIMSILAEGNVPMLVHGSMWYITQVYRKWGYEFGDAERYNYTRSSEPRAWVIPPHARAQMTDQRPRSRICYVSGWALMENQRTNHGATLMAPISDHADYYELIDVIETIRPRRLWPVHSPYVDLFAIDMGQRFGIQSVALEGMVIDDEA